ncbi:MAG: alpha-galactosidase, partial [Muribaculaceae bacterium]|nr:alpha-galactosidase [Muribaculaceae bacterium]
MKKTILTTAFFSLLTFTHMSAWQGNIVLNTPATSMVLFADESGLLRQSYFGERLTEQETEQLRAAGMETDQPVYPAFGQNDMLDLPAIQVLHGDGQYTFYPTVDDVVTTQHDHYRLTTIVMTDKKYPVTLKLFYKAYSTVDMIETWTEITN